ncbi:MAG: site-specific integrase [Candidatus Binatus sp.]|uniref:tyrosine-type recombinase/integrase n=1 Tax=Candidatus Binatus sp. TaxID=2811406 RepID=UPI003C71E8B7
MNKRGQGGVYLRGETYWMRYRLNGDQVRESTGESTEENALLVLHKRIGHVEAGLKVGGSFDRSTLREILDDVYTDYTVNELRSTDRIKKAGWHLLEHFGQNCKAKSVTSARVQSYKLARKKDDAANGTINRELALLKRAMTLGGRNGKVANKPYIELLEETAREGFLSHAEYLKLSAALPADLKDPVHFLYLSGWRVSEMRSLTWSDVDRPGKTIRLRIENSKNKTSRVLKPGAELWAVIERAAARQIPSLPNVFHRDGAPVGLFRKSWATALDAAGLKEGTLVHDLRRCAARNYVRAGISETVVMKLTGHKTPSIFRRYNVTDEQDIADAGVKLDTFINAQPKQTADVIPFRKAS